MNTLAWVLILTAALLIRQVSKGRVMNLGEDVSDAFIAIASGDQTSLAEVFSRTGDGTTATKAFDSLAAGSAELAGGFATAIPGAVGSLTDQAGAALNTGISSLQAQINNNIALWAIKLGETAKGYRLTATGPDYYDCSGLVWRACQKVGYKGSRFTTATILLRKDFVRLASPSSGVSNVTTGDIVLWSGHHMGVVTTPGRFYSARSVNSGIGEANIAGFRKGQTPIYLRYVKK